MDKKAHDKVTAFDTLFTTNHIQMLKIILPCLEHPMQKTLAVYIKYLEFQYTLSYFQSHSYELCGCSPDKEKPDAAALCAELLPYCTNSEKQQIEQIAGLFRSMEMYQEMSRTFEMMKDLFPEGFDGAFPSGAASAASGLWGESAGPTDSENADATQGEPSEDADRSENVDHPAGGGSGMMDMLMNMLSPEQKAMFEMLGGESHNGSK